MVNKDIELEQTLDLGDVEEKNPPLAPKTAKKEKAEKTIEQHPESANKKYKKALISGVVAGIFVLLNAFYLYEIVKLNKVINHTYVYNMEAVLMHTGMADENRKFEANMAELEKEIDKAEKKVNSMKDKKLQEEYREMYMKSLTLKRNTLVEEHEKFMKSLLKNINKTLTEVAKNYGVKVIFNNRSVVFSTNYVTDLTPDVAKKLKAKMEDD